MEIEKLKKISESLIDPFFDIGNKAKKMSEDGLKISIKIDNSPVTNGDIFVDNALRKNIQDITPDIPIVSEETVNLKKPNLHKNFWLIDPIDGTKQYMSKKDEYTLNASLIINSKPVIGIIYAPAKKRMFVSYGKGCAFEIDDNKKKNVLNCKKKTNSNIILGISYTKNPSENILNIFKKHKVTNFFKMSSSFKFCVIAAGEFDIYTCEPRAYEWDISAGHAIVTHAGGIFTTQDGNEVIYGKKNYKNPSLLVKRSNNLEI